MTGSAFFGDWNPWLVVSAGGGHRQIFTVLE